MSRKNPLKIILEAIFQFEARVAAAWSSSAHRRLMLAQWSLPPHPDHFDHHIDLQNLWLKTRNPLWVERGVFSLLALKGGRVLELACGDGFNARNFYSLKSERIVACDIDPSALATARHKNSAPNIEYVEADFRHAMPGGAFDNVVWDFAFPIVRYFQPAEIEQILVDIKKRLTPSGVLSGYTLADQSPMSDAPSRYQFRQMGDLQAFLAPHFKHVIVFETVYPGRHNFYFWASDAELPFQTGWPHAVGVSAANTASRTETA